MDDGQQELNPQQPEEGQEPNNISDFEEFKNKQSSQSNSNLPNESPNSQDEAVQEKLRKNRELIEMAKKIRAAEKSGEITPDERELWQRLKDEYSKENDTVSLEEAIARDFMPDQVEDLKALQEIHRLENTWQHGEKVLQIRDYLYKEATKGSNRYVPNDLPAGREIVGSVKPWEGEGEIVVVSYENREGEEKRPGSVQLVYDVKAPEGNHINNGSPSERKVTVTIRNPRSSRPKNEGRLYILDSNTDPETEEKETRQFDSENVKPLKDGDMTQDEAISILQLVVDAYDDSVEAEEGIQEKKDQENPPEELPKVA